MPRRTRNRRPTGVAPLPTPPNRVPTGIAVLGAGALGAVLTWFSLSDRTVPTRPPQPSAVVASETPPAIAHLPPADAAVLLGNWHYDRQRWFQAIEQYEAALRLGQDNANVRTDLGNCFRFAGQPQKALEQYEISQRMDPRHENSLFNKAALYGQELNQISRAKELLAEYLLKFPSSQGAPRAQQLLGELTVKERTQDASVKAALQQVIEK